MKHHHIPPNVTPVDWFRRIPNGGTFFVDEARAPVPSGRPPAGPVTPVDWFRRMPTGGTFFVDPARTASRRPIR